MPASESTILLSFVALLSLAAPSAGCLLVSHFDASRTAEISDALCSDGVDNDGDGLADCQDWKCLGRKACCTMPIVVLADNFESPACALQDCAHPDPTCAPDPSRWASWGLPMPLLCGGSFSPHKAEICYDVGTLGNAPLSLHPGLSVVAHVVGVPEAAGRLELGLTLQETVGSAPTSCSAVDGVQPVASLQYINVLGAGVVLARFDRSNVGTSPSLSDNARHELRLTIGTDLRVSYALDGQVFATSPPDQPLPMEALRARVSLSGRGLAARFDDVAVTDGTQCESPSAWQPEMPFVVLRPSPIDADWDSFSVRDPAFTIDAEGNLLLYYTGCRASLSGGDCSPSLGLGRIRSRDGVNFVRDPQNPRLQPLPHTGLTLGIVSGDPPASTFGFVATTPAVQATTEHIFPATEASPQMMLAAMPVLDPGGNGQWDDGDVCCMTALQHDGRTLMWYAGHAAGDSSWRIGLATSSDGATFVRGPGPVLAAGGRESSDSRGVTAPVVVYDSARKLFRMWYRAEAFLGLTSIGYAVSTDGTTWHKYPANPVLSASDLGLDAVGRPAVHLEEGQTRMWLDAVQSGQSGRSLFGVLNRGTPPSY